MVFVAARELAGQDKLITILSLGNLFPNPFIGFFVLVVVGGADEIASLTDEIIENFECRFLWAFPEAVLPRVTEVHGTEAKGSNPDRSGRSQLAMAVQRRARGRVNGKRHDGSLLAKCQCECKAVQVARERGLDIYLRAAANPFKITPLSCEFEISHGPTPRDV